MVARLLRIVSGILCGVILMSFVPVFAAEPTLAETEPAVFIDEFDNLDMMYSYTDGIKGADFVDNLQGGNNTGISMAELSAGEAIIYEVPFDIGSYTLYLQGDVAEYSPDFKIYFSKDGKEFTEDKYAEHRSYDGGRLFTNPEADEGVKYLKIEYCRSKAPKNLYLKMLIIREERFVAVGDSRIKRTEPSNYDYSKLPSLKEAYKDYFPLGAATEWFDITTYPELMSTQFSAIVSEGQTHFEGMQPREGNYSFEWGERIFDWGLERGMQVRLHSLMYYKGTPDWVFKHPSGQVSEELFLKRYERHVKNVVSHFKGKVKYYDVVNELVDAGVIRPYMEEFKVFGNDRDKFLDFIANLFKWAHEADPDARLVFLDYEMWYGDRREVIWRDIIPKILEKGVPREALVLGEQGHFAINTPVFEEDDDFGGNSIEAMLKEARQMGFNMAITELDIGLSSAVYASDLKGEQLSMTRDEREELAAKKWASIFDLFREYADMIEVVTFWNVTDNTNWRSQTTGGNSLLFDYNFEPYPAFYRVFDFEKKMPRWTKDDIVEIKYSNGWTDRQIQAVYGTPIIDGKLDSIWEKTEIASINRQTNGEKGYGATGDVRCMWDDKNIYVFMDVTDDILNSDSEFSYFKDCVEVFIGENNLKGGGYGEGDRQLRIAIDDTIGGWGHGGWDRNTGFKAAVQKTDKGCSGRYKSNLFR